MCVRSAVPGPLARVPARSERPGSIGGVSGSGQLLGSGVTLYFAPGAGINFSGGGVVALSAPTIGTFAGLTVFFDRSDAATFVSDGSVAPDQRRIVGAIDAASGTLDVNELDAGQVVFNTVNVAGGGALNVGGL